MPKKSKASEIDNKTYTYSMPRGIAPLNSAIIHPETNAFWNDQLHSEMPKHDDVHYADEDLIFVRKQDFELLQRYAKTFQSSVRFEHTIADDFKHIINCNVDLFESIERLSKVIHELRAIHTQLRT